MLLRKSMMLPIKNNPNWWQSLVPNFTLLSQNRKFVKPGCKKPFKRQRKHPFQDVLLAINFNHPYYHNLPLLEWYYRPVFPNYVICGPEIGNSEQYNIIVVPQPKEYGYYGFQCLVEAIRRNPGYAGYLYINDDMIVNWWNFYNLNRTKIWFPNLNFGTTDMTLPAKSWWRRASCLERCIKAYSSMEKDQYFRKLKVIKMYMENVGHKRVCVNSLSDIVYIPQRLAKKYAIIAQRFYDYRLFLEVASPMAILMLEKKADMVLLDGVYLQLKYNNWGPWTGDTTRAWRNYNYKIHLLHPYKLTGQNQLKNTREFVTRIINVSQTILTDNCFDSLEVGRFWAKT